MTCEGFPFGNFSYAVQNTAPACCHRDGGKDKWQIGSKKRHTRFAKTTSDVQSYWFHTSTHVLIDNHDYVINNNAILTQRQKLILGSG